MKAKGLISVYEELNGPYTDAMLLGAAWLYSTSNIWFQWRTELKIWAIRPQDLRDVIMIDDFVRLFERGNRN